MISAYNPTNSSLSFHHEFHFNFKIELYSNGGCSFESKNALKFPKIHGYLMWFAWTIIGMIQIWTGRYLQHYWRWRQFLHSVLGGLIGILTLSGAIVMLDWLGWNFYFDHLHNFVGILSVFLGLLLVLGGIFALY